MLAQIYRFEILRALANAVFEARDENTGAIVTLYEWTPEASAREASRGILETVARNLDCEVFSADASLYLVAKSPQQGRGALDELRKRGIFSGAWLEDRSAPPPPLPPPPPTAHPASPQTAAVSIPPPRSPSTSTSDRIAKMFAAIVVSGIVAFILGLVVMSRISDKSSVESELREANYRVSEAENTASQQRSRADDLEQTNKQFQNINLLHLGNDCRFPVRVAIRYLAFNQSWVTQGWWDLHPGEGILLATSPSPDFYVYGVNTEQNMSWFDKDGLSIDIVPQTFSYTNNQGLNDSNRAAVKTFHVHTEGPEFYHRVSCN